jgi:hypothetical protein
MAVLAAIAAGAPAADGDGLAPGRAEAFLSDLVGEWRGEAVTTPIGARPYDISFVRTVTGEIEGSARPGGAVHRWTFGRDRDRVRLRFLTTFGGNREPLLLTASEASEQGLVFRAQRPAFLSVRFEVSAESARIRVYHGEGLHVEIRLHRQ